MRTGAAPFQRAYLHVAIGFGSGAEYRPDHHAAARRRPYDDGAASGAEPLTRFVPAGKDFDRVVRGSRWGGYMNGGKAEGLGTGCRRAGNRSEIECVKPFFQHHDPAACAYSVPGGDRLAIRRGGPWIAGRARLFSLHLPVVPCVRLAPQ